MKPQQIRDVVKAFSRKLFREVKAQSLESVVACNSK
jgi:hypothetical protein